MLKEIRQIGSFEAIDAGGEKYLILCFREFLDGIGGLKSMRTAGGQAVNVCLMS